MLATSLNTGNADPHRELRSNMVGARADGTRVAIFANCAVAFVEPRSLGCIGNIHDHKPITMESISKVQVLSSTLHILLAEQGGYRYLDPVPLGPWHQFKHIGVELVSDVRHPRPERSLLQSGTAVPFSANPSLRILWFQRCCNLHSQMSLLTQLISKLVTQFYHKNHDFKTIITQQFLNILT